MLLFFNLNFIKIIGAVPMLMTPAAIKYIPRCVTRKCPELVKVNYFTNLIISVVGAPIRLDDDVYHIRVQYMYGYY